MRERSLEHLLDFQLFTFIYQIFPDQSNLGRRFCAHFNERHPSRRVPRTTFFDITYSS